MRTNAQEASKNTSGNMKRRVFLYVNLPLAAFGLVGVTWLAAGPALSRAPGGAAMNVTGTSQPTTELVDCYRATNLPDAVEPVSAVSQERDTEPAANTVTVSATVPVQYAVQRVPLDTCIVTGNY